MKTFNKSLVITLSCLLAGSALGMKPPKGHSQSALQLHSQNASITKANQAQYQNKPYFTFNVMQPADRYFTLIDCVDHLFKGGKFPANYRKTSDKKWHISTMVIAVPFQGQPNEQEVESAMADLNTIIKRYKTSLQRVTYTFKSLESIGKHTSIAAHYDFKLGRTEFLESYASIINDFLKLHPTAWMLFGYKTNPHISVAKTSKPGGKVKISTTGCKPINDIALMHEGRNLYISAGYYDPAAQKTKVLKPNPL